MVSMGRCGVRAATRTSVFVLGTSALTDQEKVMEFLFFDLSSCVTNQTGTPTPPPLQ
jgi:hypothetical protein